MAETRERRLLWKIERYFKPMERASSNQEVLGENVMIEAPRKKSFRKKRDRSSAKKSRHYRPRLTEGNSTAEEESQGKKINHTQLNDNE